MRFFFAFFSLGMPVYVSKVDVREKTRESEACVQPRGSQTSPSSSLWLREKFFPKSLSLSQPPMMALRGEREFLIDEYGTSFLDTRNNVPILGHSDPRVAEAICQQARLLSTNTRYLHPNLGLLAEALSSILPPELGKFLFVNSGSEAVDLALQLARIHIKSHRVIALSRAYHGTTFACKAVSESVHAGALFLENWVSVVPCPDLLNGPCRSVDECVAQVEQASSPCASFIVESVLSVGGGVFMPAQYLSRTFTTVRNRGGVCICDETQVGLGRTGRWWAFEWEGVVPDILVIGKQLGNGFPIAAVVFNEAISKSLEDSKIPFFSTYAGSTLACAAGLATVRGLIEERAPERAAHTGTSVLQQIRQQLGECPNFIADIRGRGMYIAIEFVSPSVSRAVQEFLFLNEKILTSLDGPSKRVMIVKPPLCFTEDSGARFALALRRSLRNL